MELICVSEFFKNYQNLNLNFLLINNIHETVHQLPEVTVHVSFVGFVGLPVRTNLSATVILRCRRRTDSLCAMNRRFRECHKGVEKSGMDEINLSGKFDKF